MPTTPRQRESEFQRDVVATLRTLGYLATSIRRSDGVTIGDVGLPDVLAVHPITGAFLALELKADPRRHATPAQVEWLVAFAKPRSAHDLPGRAPRFRAPAADLAMVVRPEDWPEVAEIAAELAGHNVAAR